MTTGAIQVRRPGLHTTIQDLGRWGFRAEGMPVSGPMDPFAHRLANVLVGNAPIAATLEVTLLGPELEFDTERLVAVTGAVFALTVDGVAVPCGRPFLVPANSTLSFGARMEGARGYIAIEGGLDVPVVLGSRSTRVPSAVGGWQGRALIGDDRVPLGPARRGRAVVEKRTTMAEDWSGPPRSVVRVLPGPDSDRFAADALDVLQSGGYTISEESNRMGFRLNGAPLGHTRGADIISDATPPGSLQVPASGQPTLLMADCQTTGGYARIATVISADIGIAGQAAPGDRLWFEVCTPADALAALMARERQLLALENRPE